MHNAQAAAEMPESDRQSSEAHPRQKTLHVVPLIEQIMAGVAAIQVGDYELPAAELQESDEIVGQADEYLMRLFTYRSRKLGERQKLATEGQTIVDELDGAIFGSREETRASSVSALLKGLFGKNSSEMEAKAIRLEEIESALTTLRSETDILEGLFWAEVRQRHPSIKDHSAIGIRSGWEIVKITKVDSTDLLESIFEKVFGRARRAHSSP